MLFVSILNGSRFSVSAPTLPFLQVLIPYNGRQWLSVYHATINDVLINMGGGAYLTCGCGYAGNAVFISKGSVGKVDSLNKKMKSNN